MEKLRSYRVTIIAPTCFYYQVPLFRALAADPCIDLTVCFCSDEGNSGKDVKAAYGSDEKWGVEDQLLDGYSFKFLRNYSPNGSYLKSLVGLANFGIWAELNRERPDVVIVMSWMNPTWWLTFLACLRFDIPVLFMTDANVDAEHLKSPWKSWLKRAILGKFLFRITSGFLCAGTANRQLYASYGVPDNKLVPFAYSWGYRQLIEESNQLKSSKTDLRKKYGLPQDKVLMLYCGRLSPEKGSIELLDAYEMVENPNKALVIVGDGQLRSRMEQTVKARGLKFVYFMGFQSRNDVGNFYALADFLVLPSHRETWGIVVNEALCFSLPVVVSDQVGAGVDLVIAEQTGYIFPAGNVSGLADSISRLVDLPDAERIKMGENSRKLIAQWSARDLGLSLLKYLDSIYPDPT